MADIRRILDQLGIDSAPLLFVQSSTDWLGRIGIRPSEVLTALQERLDETGTIVMPSYPFSGYHEDFLKSKPCVNLAQAPAQTGLLAELLRRRPDSLRSRDPDLPLIAWGKGAAKIVGNQPSGEDPTGADSAFARVIDSGGFHVGLGVSHNYMALIHVLDSRFLSRYPFPILSDEVYPILVEDNSGRRLIGKRAVFAELQRRIRPSRMIPALPPEQDFFRSVSIDGTLFFAWKLHEWASWACGHIAERLTAGRMPCWLDDYEYFMRGDVGGQS